MIFTIRTKKCLQINIPEIFKRPDFVDWLNNRRQYSGEKSQVATWHTGGNPDEYSDVFIYYDECSGGEFDVDGEEETPYGLPLAVKVQLRSICQIEGFSDGVLWLTNLNSSV